MVHCFKKTFPGLLCIKDVTRNRPVRFTQSCSAEKSAPWHGIRTEEQNRPLCLKYSFSPGEGGVTKNLRGSIPPGNLITKHENAARRREAIWNEAPRSAARANLRRPARRHAITRNLWNVVPGSRPASRWRINEMPRLREGEIACVTYP